jgi:hypothetical protein
MDWTEWQNMLKYERMSILDLRRNLPRIPHLHARFSVVMLPKMLILSPFVLRILN